MLKRAADIAGAALLATMTSPILLVALVAIKFFDGGPILFKQKRIGKGGEVFFIYKFRTMVPNADRIGGHSTADGDPRITRVGRVLRRLSIDELPQLFNVLRGEMSLVGPRPDVPAQIALYTPDEFARRQSVRPGITGLAQALARSMATVEERKALDLEYVDRCSFRFDLKIMAMTLKQICTKGGN